MCIDWFQWNIYIVHVYFYEAASFLFKKKTKNQNQKKTLLKQGDFFFITSKDFIMMRVYLYK